MIIHKAKVELAFTGLVLAGIAKDLNALAFINQKRIEEDGQAVLPSDLPEAEEEKQYSQLVFRRVDGVPAADEHMIKGMVRETFKRTGDSRKLKGVWSRISTEPYLIPFKYDGDIMKEVRAFTGQTLQGPRSVVCVHEAILKPSLVFELQFHDHEQKFDIKLFKEVLDYAGRYVGFGGGRTKNGLEYSYGMFTVEKFEVMESSKFSFNA